MTGGISLLGSETFFNLFHMLLDYDRVTKRIR